jgi:ABC-type multidrug transport system ATPase subunit
MKVIDCKNLSFGYIKKPLCICDESFSLTLGKNLFIFGDKGAGKSTMLKLLCGMEEHYFGKIEICGKPPKESSRQISYLPTDLVALKNKTVIKNLQFACDQIGLPKETIVEDEWLKINGGKKVKKLSNIDKFIFAIKRAKLKMVR